MKHIAVYEGVNTLIKKYEGTTSSEDPSKTILVPEDIPQANVKAITPLSKKKLQKEKMQ